MKFTVKSTVLVEDLPKDLLEDVKKDLTITNPAFSKKMAMGLSIWGIDQYQRYYSKKKNGVLEIPVGYLPKLTEEIIRRGHDAKDLIIIDQRTAKGNKAFFGKLEFTAKLRDYQDDMKNSALSHTLGVVQAKTGSGKTVCFVKIVVDRKQNTLILVNTKELASQTVDAFVNFTNLEKDDIGFIGSGRYEMKPITVGILQTMRSIVDDEDTTRLDEINGFFGQSIADETHIIAAETYYNVMASLNFKFKFGFSATPFREDGLTDVIHFANGPLIHRVPDEAVEDHLVIPGYKQIMTDYYFPLMDTSEYQNMITHMAEDKERNDFIIEYFKSVGEHLPSVFLCNRTSQVEYLHENIENSIMLTSKMSKKLRELAMEMLRSGEAIHVASTFGLFSTGLDIPRLECEYLVSPMKSEIKLRQSAGRLMRKASGKHEAMIYDFVDKRIGLLYGQSRTRKRILTSL